MKGTGKMVIAVNGVERGRKTTSAENGGFSVQKGSQSRSSAGATRGADID